MTKVSIQRKNEGKSTIEKGLSQKPLLPGASNDVEIYQCKLDAKNKIIPELFKYEDKIQFFFFTNASGYVATDSIAHNITDKAVYVPDYDREPFFIQAGEEDLNFVHFIGKQNKIDVDMMNECHIVLPRFRLLKDSWRYTEGFTGDAGSNVKSHMVLEHEYFGRYSMGWNCGTGPTFIGEHTHPDLEQWYYGLDDTEFYYIAGDEEYEFQGGDISHTVIGTPHGSKSDAGKKIDYVWFELATNGYL